MHLYLSPEIPASTQVEHEVSHFTQFLFEFPFEVYPELQLV